VREYPIEAKKRIKVLTISLFVVFLYIPVALMAGESLSFQQRVDAQEAIERVYYSHRKWPKATKTPKPPFELAVTKKQLEAKVTDYLKKSEALEEIWNRPVTGKQLQAEMDRMARNSKDPAILQELFNSLNNDPYLIAECLARPVLVNRLIHNWYSSDKTLHAEAYKRAQEALQEVKNGDFASCVHGKYSRIRYKLSKKRDPQEDTSGGEIGEPFTVRLDEDKWSGLLSETPEQGMISSIKDSQDAYSITHTVIKTENSMEVERLRFTKVSFDKWWAEETGLLPRSLEIGFPVNFILPETKRVSLCNGGWENDLNPSIPGPRSRHAAVWTGSEMIIWGGSSPACFYNGSRYDPATDTWTFMSGDGAPTLCGKIDAIWTGSEMIVWGQNASVQNVGARYNPLTDTWTDISTTDAPTTENYSTAVWTGSEMIVWGGYEFSNCGGRYNPDTDSWTPVSNTGAPSSRKSHTAVWTGSEMIIWGGYNSSYLNSGGCYDPATDKWTATSITNAPVGRLGHTAVWTGSEMIIWGGFDGSSSTNTGGCYDPASGSWTATSETNVPVGRFGHTAVWTGSEMIIWGGYDSSGGRYDPSTNTWSSTSLTNAPAPRYYLTAVWTGSEMIIWGGEDGAFPNPNRMNTGGRYDPTSDSWVSTSVAGAPSERSEQSSVWTGSEMIIWGGNNGDYPILGGRYNPSTDSWTPTSTNGAPIGRIRHVTVWTGSEMIVWGGENGGYPTNTGGRYDPLTDTWTATPTAGAPSAREELAAVWTGSEMIVWGGFNFSGCQDTGGKYDPFTDTWTAISQTKVPAERCNHKAVWTGTEMIVWGGSGQGGSLDTGGRYDPSTDSWTATSQTNAPTARYRFTAVWTGTDMIVWSGMGESGYSSTGGRYNPTTDTWTPTSTVNAPTGREFHTAVWTGTEMIVWGGCGAGGSPTTGGRYDPSTDTWTDLSQSNAPTGRFFHTAVWTGREMIVWGGTGFNGFLNTGGVFTFPIDIYPASLPGGSLGVPYSKAFTTSGGGSDCSFYVSGGALPPGLTLSSIGVLSGTPAVLGSYSFKVSAVDIYGCSTYKDYSITIAIDTTPPSAPSMTSVSANDTAISLTWSASTDAETGIDHYTIYGGASGQETTTETGHTLSGLQANTEYRVTVTATNGAGLESDPSNEICITTTLLDISPLTPCSTTIVYPDDSAVNFTWTDGGDTKWRIDIYSDAGLTSKITSSATKKRKWLGSTSWTPNSKKWNKILAGGSTPGVVYWQVEGKLGGVSPSRTLYIAPAAYAIPATPSDSGSVSASTPATFTWDLNHNKKVQVEFSSTSDFSSGVEVSSRKNKPGKRWIKGETWTAPNGKWDKIVALGSTVYWRVYAKDALGRETWSEVFTLNIGF